ncbi:2845_t:CDS:1, partial [Funneliformis mosseae]
MLSKVIKGSNLQQTFVDFIDSKNPRLDHKADIYFKTKVPSLNLDQSGITGIDCDDDKITLRGNDVDKVNQWPDK